MDYANTTVTLDKPSPETELGPTNCRRAAGELPARLGCKIPSHQISAIHPLLNPPELCQLLGEDRRTAHVCPVINHRMGHTGRVISFGGTINVLSFITGSAVEHLAGREHQTHVKQDIALREAGRTAIV